MKLFVVPTPIGNLDDITLRAISVLKNVDLILAEDTRTSGKLLKRFEINTPMQSYHMHNEHKVLNGIINKFKSSDIDRGLYSVIRWGLIVPAYFTETLSMSVNSSFTWFGSSLDNVL